MTLDSDIEKVLYSAEEIATKAEELGQQLTKDYEGKKSSPGRCFKRGSPLYGRVD